MDLPAQFSLTNCLRIQEEPVSSEKPIYAEIFISLLFLPDLSVGGMHQHRSLFSPIFAIILLVEMLLLHRGYLIFLMSLEPRYFCKQGDSQIALVHTRYINSERNSLY